MIWTLIFRLKKKMYAVVLSLNENLILFLIEIWNFKLKKSIKFGERSDFCFQFRYSNAFSFFFFFLIELKTSLSDKTIHRSMNVRHVFLSCNNYREFWIGLNWWNFLWRWIGGGVGRGGELDSVLRKWQEF